MTTLTQAPAKPRLTRFQRAVYDCIAAHIRRKGYAPTYRDLCAAVNSASVSDVHAIVDVLVARGLLVKTPNIARGLSLPPTPDAPATLEEQVGVWMDLGCVVVGYQRRDGSLAGYEAWEKQGETYRRVALERIEEVQS